MQTTVDFLLHGEVAGGSYYRGITNDQLTEMGWEQMKQAVVNRNWDQIISSPSKPLSGFYTAYKRTNQHTLKNRTQLAGNQFWRLGRKNCITN